ncbi:YbaB/EbfC family nucleoid-associated protein [Nocardia sp. GCM10030253]|uniref:YbaB/EbfC family nucleoid-associated protein n=1 Tax=Nocardia sp. GCM10030253 TaxID=3273404 RepID=UPI003624CFE4
MTDLPEWELQLQQNLAGIRRSGENLAKSAASITGHAEVRGVTIEVSANGDITSLQIAPGAMRWTSAQLTSALLDCHRRARADAAAKTEQIIRNADSRLRNPMQELLGKAEAAVTEPRQPMTEEEIQAADDAYFDRMNRRGWNR